LESSCIQVNAVMLYEHLTMLDLNEMNAILCTKEWAIRICHNLKIKILTPHDDCLPVTLVF
jgi:hypothetical protein